MSTFGQPNNPTSPADDTLHFTLERQFGGNLDNLYHKYAYMNSWSTARGFPDTCIDSRLLRMKHPSSTTHQTSMLSSPNLLSFKRNGVQMRLVISISELSLARRSTQPQDASKSSLPK